MKAGARRSSHSRTGVTLTSATSHRPVMARAAMTAGVKIHARYAPAPAGVCSGACSGTFASLVPSAAIAR